MNNIYKVIWSKAKNCYVVASEIARSHTKSASGSEKIGGTRRSLLASLMALSLLCGGLGVAEAAVVHVNEVDGGTSAVYTTDETYTQKEVDLALAEKGAAKDVAINTAAIADLKKAVGDAGSGLTKEVADQNAAIATNTKSIDTNKAAINSLKDDKLDKTVATSTFAAKTELDAKANTDLSNLTEAGKSAIKNTMSADMDSKANKADVYSKTDADGKFATNDALNDLKDTVNGKADKSYVDTEVGKKANKATTLGGYGITDAYTKGEVYKKDEVYNKGEVARKLDKKADQTALDQATGKINDQQTAIDKLNDKTTEISYAAGEGTKISGVRITDGNIVGNGHSTITGLANVQTDQINGKSLAGTTVATATEVEAETLARKEADNKLDKKIDKEIQDRKDAIGTIAENKNYIEKDKSVSDNLVKLDAQAKKNADAIDATNKRTAGIKRDDVRNETTIENNVTVDNLGNVTAEGAVNAGSLNVTGASDLKGNVTLGTPNGANTVTVNGNADFNEAVNMDNGLTVDKGLNVTSGESNLKNTTVDGTLSVNKETTLKKTDVNGALTVQGEATFTKKVTMENDLEVKGELKTDKIAMENKKTDPDGTIHRSATTITADGITHIGEVEKSGVITKSQFTHTEEGSETYATKGDKTDWTETRSDVKADGVKTEVKDSKGNRTNTSQTTEVINGFAIDEDGNSSTTSQTAKDINGNVTDKDGNKTDMKVTATENSIQIQDKDGKNTNHQVNTMGSSKTEIKNGDGKTTKTEQTATDIINTAKDGTIKNEANHIENTATTMKTTVTGQATEEFNGGLDTTVTGTENHTVNGKQINTIKNGQENIISGGQTNTITGGQTNTITGGQTNNITGDQTTTITGNKKETVTENVTEDYQKDLTTTVGGNENHEVKGTKTETVEGKVTENYKAGQATNVTGNQDIKVSGTQTTTATDIKRNASSGMIDTIDNDYGTNTETKVAGKTTTDVSIKGTGEEGKYIRGANESRDYLIKGTLKNSETKTVEKTSTEITDGNGKTSATIQDKTQISGSVTNGTSSAVSNVKADSIDTAVIEGTNTSLISQKKDSITSAVGNDTTSTVIQQGDKDITIASNGGTVGIVGKDIINNATNEITNTAGTKITDKVGNNTRVIDQTSITDTVGTASRKIEDGKITDTAGDSTVTTENGKGTTFAKAGSAAYSTEAGAPTDTNIAGNHITTGRVDANELGVSDKDDQGNTADFSVKAGKGIKGSVTDKDGNKTYTTVTATENSFQVQDKDGNIKNHQVNTKDSSENTITNGDKTNTVTSTADGTTFNNSKANTAFEGGTYTDTTIKGNTITTGKVTMDYADVMKDLGVRGSAKVDQNLEVGGTSTLKGDVTMESNAKVKKNLTVEGTTTTKTLKVTENAEIDGTLKVAKKATFDDSVSIAKDLSVGGDVTAKSYKVGDKTYIDANGINANNQKITNVADGSISEGSKDAVNGGQLYNVKNDLEGKVNKVGANAAAMANLHPMEFDPDSKWNIAAAIGNYGSETAAALGAFYRPNDDVMVNLSTAFGTGENMVGGGVSVRLGKGGNKLSREESNALKDQVNDLTARMDALLSVLNPNMSKDFPDVPENHWAYEAVSRLAGNDIVQGYPDGEFHGERTMTRYEMAEIIYNALSRGAEAEKELVEEFKPELQAMVASEKATAERAEG